MDATIVIPTKNGGDLLGKVLDSIYGQKTKYEYEVICVDSGSTDETLELLERYPCKVYEIPPEEFGHGKTRNYGASKGIGEFILFLTQDALPANDMWLQNFIDAMKMDEEIVGGFGRHIPYPECNVLDKRDLELHFKGFGTENTVYQLGDLNRYKVDEGYRHFLAFYSDNNSCMRRKVWEQYPYDDVDFAEDQIWARKMIEAGYKKLYCENAVVYHSHNYPLKTYFSRYYDEYKSLYHLHHYVMFQNKEQMKNEIRNEIDRDIAYIKDKNNDINKKAYWCYYAIVRDTFRCWAGYISGRYHLYSKSVQEFLDCHISQQYKQIHGKSGRVKKKKSLDREFWRWLLLNPDLIEKKEEQEIQEIEEKKEKEVQINEPVETNKIDVCGFYDFVMKQKKIPLSQKEYAIHKDGKIILNWVIPEMGVGSGGHINIFRFVKHLQNMGFKNKIYILKQENLHSDEEAREFLKTYYELDDEGIEVHVDIEMMRFAHATIATSWITAYCVRDFDNTISKFYFVQDFEPLFYPVGSDYVFAENTYKLGFRGLTAGDWLRDKLNQDYGMRTSSFSFSYDHDLYQPGEKRDDVKRIFFYARPVTARRDFELGLLALKALTDRMPEVEVAFAGWDVSNYKIDFKHANLGSVKLTELSDLYAQCDMCLVLSNTNLSLLPLEVMASNSVAVCTKGDNSSWLVNEENSILVDFDADLIADKLEYYLKNPKELEKVRKKGLQFAQSTSWEKEALKVKEAIERGIKEDEESISTRW